MFDDRPTETGLVACPQCAERIQPRARICRFCRYDLTQAFASASGTRPTATQPVDGLARKSPGLAVLLALCVPGLGHVYVRRIGLAIAFFVPIVICALRLVQWAGMKPGDTWDKDAEHLTIVALVVLQIAQIVSAGVLAARHNEVPGATR